MAGSRSASARPRNAIPREALFEPLLFPESEYRGRVERAQDALRRARIGALLLTDDRNRFYFGGFGASVSRDGRTRPAVLVLAARADPFWLVHESVARAVDEMTWIADVRVYSAIDRFPVQDLARALGALGRGVVGLESGAEQRLGMALDDLERLRAELPGATWRDAAPLLWRLRSVKSAAEIGRVRRAATMTSRAYRRAFAKIRAGMTEREAATQLAAALTAEGAHATWNDVLTGDYSRPNGVQRTRRIEPGEMVWADMGANYAGYWADFSRAAVVGGPTVAQTEAQRRVIEATEAGVAAIRPGVALRDVAAVLDRACARLGVSMNRRPGRYGHGVGLAVTEPPHVASFEETLLAPGMIVTIEPGMWREDGMYHCEEEVLVTASGCEILSDAPRDLAAL